MTVAEWHHHIRTAPNLVEAMNRLQEAADAGVDFPALLALSRSR